MRKLNFALIALIFLLSICLISAAYAEKDIISSTSKVESKSLSDNSNFSMSIFYFNVKAKINASNLNDSERQSLEEHYASNNLSVRSIQIDDSSMPSGYYALNSAGADFTINSFYFDGDILNVNIKGQSGNGQYNNVTKKTLNNSLSVIYFNTTNDPLKDVSFNNPKY